MFLAAMPNADLSSRRCDHCGVVGALFPEQNRGEVWINGSSPCPWLLHARKHEKTNEKWTMDEDVFPFDIRDFHDQASLSKSWGRGLDGWNVQGASSNFFICFLWSFAWKLGHPFSQRPSRKSKMSIFKLFYRSQDGPVVYLDSFKTNITFWWTFRAARESWWL